MVITIARRHPIFIVVSVAVLSRVWSSSVSVSENSSNPRSNKFIFGEFGAAIRDFGRQAKSGECAQLGHRGAHPPPQKEVPTPLRTGGRIFWTPFRNK